MTTLTTDRISVIVASDLLCGGGSRCAVGLKVLKKKKKNAEQKSITARGSGCVFVFFIIKP